MLIYQINLKKAKKQGLDSGFVGNMLIFPIFLH
jgi:hypothetical protein